VLQTFGARPQGTIAVINPGEPLHIREADFDSTLDWYSVCTEGETLLRRSTSAPKSREAVPLTRRAARCGRSCAEIPGRRLHRTGEMTTSQDTALIAGQLANLTRTVEEMASQLKALRERADSQQERADSQQERTEIQQERIDLAARELADVSERLQAAANALRESI
jgi:hypothetical protein